MAIIERFLGKKISIPENLRYSSQGLWARLEAQSIVFGFTEPALLLCGGINEINFLCENGDTIEKNQSVLFAVTGKIAYIDSPVGGTISLNTEACSDTSKISADPYGNGWLFRVNLQGSALDVYESFSDFKKYIKDLEKSEGFRNPDGLKGGVSGMCKAVYSGIREQTTR